MERCLLTTTYKQRAIWAEEQEGDRVEDGYDLRRGGGWE